MMMFSINPAYDYHEGAYAIGSADERSGIYRRCEAENIGITVMKPFSGGQLLNAHSSPFGVALTPYARLLPGHLKRIMYLIHQRLHKRMQITKSPRMKQVAGRSWSIILGRKTQRA